MKNRWNEREARTYLTRYKSYGPALALRTYTARLIGQDSNLVLHGGGNTSVKTAQNLPNGKVARVICIKGSGWDLDTIEPAGHPAVKMEAMEPLRALPSLSDEAMVNMLRTNMLDSTGPTPSVETLLHAFLPHTFIDHSHADAVLAITNHKEGEKLVRAWVGGRMGIVPYIMPGFALAKLAAEIYEKKPHVEGLILLKHGIFTFGETAKESYDRMIRWVDSAERFLARGKRSVPHVMRISHLSEPSLIGRTANILRGLSSGMVVRHRASPAILEFAASRELWRLSQQGPATPDHIIRTKARPLILPLLITENENKHRAMAGARLNAFIKAYQRYFARQSKQKRVARKPLDPYPRLAVVPGQGLFALAADAKAADIALDIYEHTIQVITKAERLAPYQALSESDLFDMEYWVLEQAKLGKTIEKPMSRKVVWISGAASGIGLATAKTFANQGAHVFMTDMNAEALAQAARGCGTKTQIAWDVCDVTRSAQVSASFDRCSAAFGGVDIVVSNAGIAPMSEMATCSDDILRRSFEVNFFAHQYVAQAAIRVFKRQSLEGVLLFNASKSAFNPGPEFGPYSIPKAGVIALMRQYAIELGRLGVRVNAVNADRIRTNLFAGDLLARRAKARGVTLQEYLQGNLLGQEVLAEDVAQAFVFLALAKKTTGAVLPVDGGNAAAFPR